VEADKKRRISLSLDIRADLGKLISLFTPEAEWAPATIEKDSLLKLPPVSLSYALLLFLQ
jgi:hypothetical protein